MRRLMVMAALLAPVMTWAGPGPSTPKLSCTWPLVCSGTYVSMFGPIIPETLGTPVSHFYATGAGIREKYGTTSWTVNGTIPNVQVVTSTTPSPAAIGPFSASNYLSRTAFGFTGDFIAVFIYRCDAQAADPAIYSEYHSGVGGWALEVCRSAGSAAMDWSDGKSTLRTTTGSSTGDIHVACVGRIGTTGFAKFDNTAQGTTANVATSATDVAGKLGTETGFNSFGGTIFEGYFATLSGKTTSDTDTWCGTLMTLVKARYGISAW